MRRDAGGMSQTSRRPGGLAPKIRAPKTSAPKSGPAVGRARIDALDALRGFALAGVCVANLPLFASRDDVAAGLDLPVVSRFGDPAAQFFLKVFVEGRFMTLFSIMFGLGIALMASRIAASGRRAWPALVRRLAFLAGVGLLHSTYIWSGDVLLRYGAVGLLCLLWSCARPGRYG